MKVINFNLIFTFMGVLIIIVLLSCSKSDTAIKERYGVIPYNVELRNEMNVLEKKTRAKIPPNMTSDKFYPIYFKEYKTILNKYPDSIYLLLELANYGRDAYTEESLTYANKAIELDPTIARSYIEAGLCYKTLGKYKPALSVLKKGEKVLALKMEHDLRKKRPYYTPRWHKYSEKEINLTKAYLRKLGYDPGKDVTYKVPPGKVGMKGNMCIMMAAFPLYNVPGLTHSSNMDLVDLDTITHLIKSIK